MKRTIKNQILFVFIATAMIGMSCGDQFGIQSSDDNLVDPEVQELVSSDVRSADDLIWSKTTDEIIWLGATSIKAIHAQSHSQRTIYKPGQAYALKISHDGNSLFYIRWPQNHPDSLFTISLSGQNRQFLFTNVNKILSFYWTDESFRIVECITEDVLNKECLIRDISTDDTLYTLPLGTDDPNSITWSPDGNKVAFWIVDCLKSDWVNCWQYRFNLWLADVTSQIHVRLGKEDTPERASFADTGVKVFSPDNTRIAFIMGINSASLSGSIYVKGLP